MEPVCQTKSVAISWPISKACKLRLRPALVVAAVLAAAGLGAWPAQAQTTGAAVDCKLMPSRCPPQGLPLPTLKFEFTIGPQPRPKTQPQGKPAKPVRVGAKVDEGLVLQSVQPRRASLGASLDSPALFVLELPVSGK